MGQARAPRLREACLRVACLPAPLAHADVAPVRSLTTAGTGVPELQPTGADSAGLLTRPACTALAGTSGGAAVAGRSGTGHARSGVGHTDRSAPEVQAGAPAADAPGALTGVLGGGHERPTLSLALLVAGVLFLLAQGRIRDPELLGAPVEADPGLDLEPFPRNGGGR